MDNENLFEGIPALDDEQGFQNYVDNQGVQAATEGLPSAPALLQSQTNPNAANENPAQDNANQPMYTQAQVDALIAQQKQQLANYYSQQGAQTQPQAQPQMQSQAQPNYVNQQNYNAIEQQKNAIIQQLLANGVPMERIQQALDEGRQKNATQQRIAAIENQLREQEYQRQQNAFIDKMTGFGNKFGLTETDLVTFANKAYAMGINVAQVNDVEAVFRAVYPQQYAVRVQRMQAMPNTQLYGGASISETPRATASKAEDAYVEAFLRGAMPNQFNK